MFLSPTSSLSLIITRASTTVSGWLWWPLNFCCPKPLGSANPGQGCFPLIPNHSYHSFSGSRCWLPHFCVWSLWPGDVATKLWVWAGRSVSTGNNIFISGREWLYEVFARLLYLYLWASVKLSVSFSLNPLILFSTTPAAQMKGSLAIDFCPVLDPYGLLYFWLHCIVGWVLMLFVCLVVLEKQYLNFLI